MLILLEITQEDKTMKKLITLTLITACLFSAQAQEFTNQDSLICITMPNSIGSEGSGINSIDTDGSGISSIDTDELEITKIDSDGSGITKIDSDGSGIQKFCTIKTI